MDTPSPRWEDIPSPFLDALCVILERRCHPPEIDIQRLATEDARLQLAYQQGRRDLYLEIQNDMKRRSKHA